MNITIDVTWAHDDDIALALSGGVDSMVLYHLLTNDYKHTYNRLLIVHVNHGVRAASADEADYISDMTTRDGVRCETVTFDFKGDFSQAAARVKRYDFFNSVLKRENIKYLLTAHHLDDQYETVLQQVLTGRHLHGNLGIPELYIRDGITIVRPLIQTSKSVIRQYQTAESITYFEDASNADDDYTRNYVRHHIVPPIKNTDALDINHLINVRRDINELSAFASDYAARFVTDNQGELPRKLYLEHSDTVRRYILTALLAAAGARTSRHALDTLDTVIQSDLAQSTYSIDDVTVHIEYGRLYVRQTEVLVTPAPLSIEENGEFHYNDYRINVAVPLSELPFTVRVRQNGDKVRINNVGTKKVSRLFIDKKVPNSERIKTPVVLNSNGIIIAVGTIYNIIEPSENRLLKITKEYNDDDSK